MLFSQSWKATPKTTSTIAAVMSYWRSCVRPGPDFICRESFNHSLSLYGLGQPPFHYVSLELATDYEVMIVNINTSNIYWWIWATNIFQLRGFRAIFRQSPLSLDFHKAIRFLADCYYTLLSCLILHHLSTPHPWPQSPEIGSLSQFYEPILLLQVLSIAKILVVKESISLMACRQIPHHFDPAPRPWPQSFELLSLNCNPSRFLLQMKKYFIKIILPSMKQRQFFAGNTCITLLHPPVRGPSPSSSSLSYYYHDCTCQPPTSKVDPFGGSDTFCYVPSENRLP